MCRSPVGRVSMPDIGVGEEVVEGMVVVIWVLDERTVMDWVVDVEVRIVVRVYYLSLQVRVFSTAAQVEMKL